MPEDLAAVGVDDGGHPRLDPPPAPPIWVAEPADPTVAVLIDTKPTHLQLIHIRQQHRGRVDRRLHCPPRHAMLGGDLRHRPAGIDHRGQQRRPQPGGAAGPDRQLLRRWGERASRTCRLGAGQARLAHHHLQLAGVRDVADPLHDPGVHPRRDHPTCRAAIGKLDRLNLDPATAQRQIDRVVHPIAGRLKITLAASRREPVGSNKLVVLPRWVRQPHPSQRRATSPCIKQRLAAANCEVHIGLSAGPRGWHQRLTT